MEDLGVLYTRGQIKSANEIKRGDQIAFDRDAKYFHHAIVLDVIGAGYPEKAKLEIIHFTGEDKKNGDLSQEIVLFKTYSKNLYVIEHVLHSPLPPDEVTKRAKEELARVTETFKRIYDIENNNSEHFANWCKVDKLVCQDVMKHTCITQHVYFGEVIGKFQMAKPSVLSITGSAQASCSQKPDNQNPPQTEATRSFMGIPLSLPSFPSLSSFTGRKSTANKASEGACNLPVEKSEKKESAPVEIPCEACKEEKAQQQKGTEPDLKKVKEAENSKV